MGHLHSHGGQGSSPRVRRLLLIAVGPVVAITLIGLAVLWPSGETRVIPAAGFPDRILRARVIGSEATACPGTPDEAEAPEPAAPPCKMLRVELVSGPDEGSTVTVELSDDRETRPVRPGDLIVLGWSSDAPPEARYYFADLERRFPLLVLAALFAAVVVLLGRWRGLLALGGFLLSLALLTVFVLPAILEGRSPLAVAIVGSLAIMLVALYLAHGVNARTTTAVLGTSVSLLLTALLALIFVAVAKLTGFTSEESIYVSASAGQVNLRGLLLGGIVIGALGVLDDVTITQASAVWELRRANPSYGVRELYRSALRIGRDHIASTVNTLLLAYAGAALPLLVLFTLADRRMTDVVNGEIVAEEVVRTLVGSIGLVASVPITTWLAALVVAGGARQVGTSRGQRRRRPPTEKDDEDPLWTRR